MKAVAGYLARMMSTTKLLLPVLFPSWRFFRAVEASPRIEWRLIGAGSEDWHLYGTRAQHFSLWKAFTRLFLNAKWHEELYMVTLSERLLVEDSVFANKEIAYRLMPIIRKRKDLPKRAVFQYRVILVSREDDDIMSEEAFISALLPVQGRGK